MVFLINSSGWWATLPHAQKIRKSMRSSAAEKYEILDATSQSWFIMRCCFAAFQGMKRTRLFMGLSRGIPSTILLYLQELCVNFLINHLRLLRYPRIHFQVSQHIYEARTAESVLLGDLQVSPVADPKTVVHPDQGKNMCSHTWGFTQQGKNRPNPCHSYDSQSRPRFHGKTSRHSAEKKGGKA